MLFSHKLIVWLIASTLSPCESFRVSHPKVFNVPTRIYVSAIEFDSFLAAKKLSDTVNDLEKELGSDGPPPVSFVSLKQDTSDNLKLSKEIYSTWLEISSVSSSLSPTVPPRVKRSLWSLLGAADASRVDHLQAVQDRIQQNQDTEMAAVTQAKAMALEIAAAVEQDEADFRKLARQVMSVKIDLAGAEVRENIKQQQSLRREVINLLYKSIPAPSLGMSSEDLPLAAVRSGTAISVHFAHFAYAPIEGELIIEKGRCLCKVSGLYYPINCQNSILHPLAVGFTEPVDTQPELILRLSPGDLNCTGQTLSVQNLLIFCKMTEATLGFFMPITYTQLKKIDMNPNVIHLTPLVSDHATNLTLKVLQNARLAVSSDNNHSDYQDNTMAIIAITIGTISIALHLAHIAVYANAVLKERKIERTVLRQITANNAGS